jgi:hypothetical protein
MVFTATEVVVFAIWGDIGFHSRVSVQTADITRATSKIEGPVCDVAIVQYREDSQ